MKKIIATLGSLIAVTFILSSCLEDDYEYELTSEAYISSFSINDIKTETQSTTESGTDTTIITTLTGSDYTFAIDQLTGSIYNVDSLPQGTDITKVTINVGFTGNYILYGDESKTYHSSDSVDFSSPVKFSVYATDNISSKTYYIKLNVHQADPDSLLWQKVKESDFPGETMEKQKALLANGQVYVFALVGDKLHVTSTSQEDGRTWLPLTAAEGYTGNADCECIVTHDDLFYMTVDKWLYSSTDGIHWVTQSEGVIGDMIASADGNLYLNNEGIIVAGTPSEGWTEVQRVDTNTFPRTPWAISKTLKTNNHIVQTTLVGVPSNYTGTDAVVWSKLSTERNWTYYNPIANNNAGCPILKDMVVIDYDNKFYAFGGRGLNGEEAIEPFEGFFISKDGGITWAKQTTKVCLPEDLYGFEGGFSSLVDDEQYIWIMCSGSNNVYKGRMNRVVKE